VKFRQPGDTAALGMDYQLRGKLAVVTAGAHGIGEAIANLFAGEGAVVIVADQDAAALQEKGRRWGGTFAGDQGRLPRLDQEAAVASEWGSSENNRRARFYRALLSRAFIG
jgi:NAD(P)-dependent dehydrogenase (short-subunit alcohol dehydrogenase family)